MVRQVAVLRRMRFRRRLQELVSGIGSKNFHSVERCKAPEYSGAWLFHAGCISVRQGDGLAVTFAAVACTASFWLDAILEKVRPDKWEDCGSGGALYWLAEHVLCFV